MAEINNAYVTEKLKSQFGPDIHSSDEHYGLPGFDINPARLADVLQWLHADNELRFRFLTDICGSHYPHIKDKELCAVYHVQSMENNLRLRLRCFLPVSDPRLPSATSVYASANWMERETYDFYGIIFEGHPNLRRILNVDEMDYFPMRKEFPLEDATRTDKEDKYFGR